MVKTEKGEFRKDPSGLFHYKHDPGVVMYRAAEDAIEYAGKDATPAWFWFNGIPTPIYPNDTLQTLLERYEVFRRANHTGQLLELLEKLQISGQ